MVETMALTVTAGHIPSKDGRSSERNAPNYFDAAWQDQG